MCVCVCHVTWSDERGFCTYFNMKLYIIHFPRDIYKEFLPSINIMLGHMLYIAKNNNNVDVQKYNLLLLFSFYNSKCMKW